MGEGRFGRTFVGRPVAAAPPVFFQRRSNPGHPPMGEIGSPTPVMLLLAASAAISRPWIGPGRRAKRLGARGPGKPSLRIHSNRLLSADDGAGLAEGLLAVRKPLGPRLPGRRQDPHQWLGRGICCGGRTAEPRPLNLDPGYLSLAKLVLASTKDHSHRIYLGQGIYAEITLYYSQQRWQARPWTFADYRRDDYQQFFFQGRATCTSGSARSRSDAVVDLRLAAAGHADRLDGRLDRPPLRDALGAGHRPGPAKIHAGAMPTGGGLAIWPAVVGPFAVGQVILAALPLAHHLPPAAPVWPRSACRHSWRPICRAFGSNRPSSGCCCWRHRADGARTVGRSLWPGLEDPPGRRDCRGRGDGAVGWRMTLPIDRRSCPPH